MGSMLKQLRQMQKELVKAQKELAKETIVAEAEGGEIRVSISGDQRLTDLHISPEFLASNDAKKLSAVLKKAFNQALEDSRNLAQERLGPLSNGMNF
jgi:DNA-binding YbaB/EbfC family protein